ncbi:hypothetical protein [uncultured Thermomonospora sp.]|uniref:hypothetical protein n=1 Tax=uncultured Thermomonospora sp. TaxID=671175 RepID=UPI00259BCBE2|nr:hypothetical protein [uncultured Thermomonospora sp.]
MTSSSAPATLGPMTGRDLARLLTAVLVHTATPDEEAFFDEYTHLACEIDRGHLYLVATDRYTLGVIRHPLPDDQPHSHIAITLTAAAARRLLRALNPRAEVTVQIDPTGLTVHEDDGLRHHLPAAPLEYCFDWRRYLGGHLARLTQATSRPTVPVTLDPGLLARFAHAAAYQPPAPSVRRPLQFHVTGQRTPVLVTCGSHFIGAIASIAPTPGSKDHPADPLQGWRAICPPPPAPARTAA